MNPRSRFDTAPYSRFETRCCHAEMHIRFSNVIFSMKLIKKMFSSPSFFMVKLFITRNKLCNGSLQGDQKLNVHKRKGLSFLVMLLLLPLSLSEMSTWACTRTNSGVGCSNLVWCFSRFRRNAGGLSPTKYTHNRILADLFVLYVRCMIQTVSELITCGGFILGPCSDDQSLCCIHSQAAIKLFRCVHCIEYRIAADLVAEVFHQGHVREYSAAVECSSTTVPKRFIDAAEDMYIAGGR